LDIRRDVAQLSGRRELQQLRLVNLRQRRVADPSLGEQIPVAEEALADLDERLQQRRLDYQRLTLSAPAAGCVLPPSPRDEPLPDGQLRTWTGSPLDEQSRGAYLETGVLVCRIGDPRRLGAVLVVDQADIAFVRPSQRVSIQLDQLPGETFGGAVEEIAEIDLEDAPRELVSGGHLPAIEDEHAGRRPLNTCYLTRVSLDDHDRPLLLGACGRAKIHVAPRSLGSRIYRYLCRTFRFEL
jgi:putative peptide zinc metalloprotease protein